MYNRPMRKRVSGSVSRAVGCWHVSGLCCGHRHAADPYGVRGSGPKSTPRARRHFVAGWFLW